VDAIRVITTRSGRAAILANLLAQPDGYFYRLLKDYHLDREPIAFSPESIRVVTDEVGNPIDDIVDEESNSRLIALCLEELFTWTADPDRQLIVSIAGGRKTMSACLMVAASLYARDGDRICHVLVSPEFERHPDFSTLL